MAELSKSMKRMKLLFVLIIRTVRWFFIKLFSKNGKIIKEIKGNKMVLLTTKKGFDIKEDSIFKQLALDGQREFAATKIIEQIMKPGYVILEIGANIGYYALMESRLVGETGKIFAIEPEIDNFRLLNRNIELNGIKNIEIFNFAISDSGGEVPFYLTENSNLHSMIKPKKGQYNTLMVKTKTADDFLSDKGKIDYLRMDIEGYEYQALKGMHRTLSENKNLQLFIELHCNLLRAERSIEILRKLKSYRFEIFVAISRDNYIRSVLGETKVEKLSINQLCEDERLLKSSNAFEIFFKKKNVNE